MATYDYRCATCGAEFSVEHPMSDERTSREHLDDRTLDVCSGPVERLISSVGYSRRIGTRGPSEAELARAGFTKYVRGDDGQMEKAFGPGLDPDHIEEHR